MKKGFSGIFSFFAFLAALAVLAFAVYRIYERFFAGHEKKKALTGNAPADLPDPPPAASDGDLAE